MKDCCCESLGFDGSCLSSTGELIATCLSYNATFAKCIENGKNVTDTLSSDQDDLIECAIFSCDGNTGESERDGTAEVDESIPPYVSPYLFLFIGAFMWFIYILKIKHIIKARSLRSLKQLGTYMLILGFGELFYEATLYICLLLLLLPGIIEVVEIRTSKPDDRDKYDDCAIYSPVVGDEEENVDDFDATTISYGEDRLKDLKNPPTLHAVDVYQDVTRSILRVVITFGCQYALLIMYAYLIVVEGNPDFSNVNTIGYYILGAIVQVTYDTTNNVIAVEEKKREYFCFWIDLMFQLQKKNTLFFVELQGFEPDDVEYNYESVMKEKTSKKLEIPSSIEIKIRIAMSVVVNYVGRNIILLLLPWHLAQSESMMDFILNAIAAYFIIDIDDLQEPVTYIFFSEKLQALYKLEHPEDQDEC
mmetsp:Transcript_3/g.2  ORF Transcript_3/g.2 Transcript_3/m.2 type:complete len:419 (-) Transcript_3:81-1337(-)